MKQRLDQNLVKRGLVISRSQAESYIRLGKVTVGGKVQQKPGFLVGDDADIKLTAGEQYVSRAGMKLASVAEIFGLDFRGKTVLDVGSSTGGFTDYALKHGAAKVIAVDVGTNQLHPSLRSNSNIELHEQTDIRDFVTDEAIDIVVGDVSFISLREILPHVATLCSPQTDIAVMVKPQFEVYVERSRSTATNMHPSTGSGLRSAREGSSRLHKGVIKNERMRRDVLKSFEDWVRQRFVIIDKADSGVAGEKGNLERFYHLRVAKV